MSIIGTSAFERKRANALAAATLAATLGLGAMAAPLPALAAESDYNPSVGASKGTETSSTAEVAVPVTVDTTGGSWHIRGDENPHPNGSYVVTVPTSISFSGLNAGYATLSASYKTKVQGIIPDGKSVVASATYEGSPYKFTVNQGKKEFTAAEVSSGAEISMGGTYILGAESTDGISASVLVNRAGVFTGNVNYAFALK